MGAAALSPPSPPSSPLAPGYCLDRYELLCPLADGGMASVWLARLVGKHGFEKQVAIKTILPQYASDERFRAMFLDEARFASQISHTNVVQILDLGEQHDILYLVMEYVDSDSLSRLHRTVSRAQGSLPHHVLLRVIADACGGLHAAHEHGIVHRDVSPQNILISTLGVTKLIDFGIAKVRSRIGEDTTAGLLKGKVSYMAPEQALGGEMDRRTDVFAMGAVLHHMLAGAPPFAGENPLATLNKLNAREPPPALPSSVPPAVAAVVSKALEHDPDERYASAALLAAAIESAMLESKLSCSVPDVARYISEHMAERTAQRREMIELALSAAAERQRVQEKLRPIVEEGSSLPSASGVVPSPLEPEVKPDEPAPRRRAIAVVGAIVLGAAAASLLAWRIFADHAPPPRPVVVLPPVIETATAETATTETFQNIPSVDINDLPKATQQQQQSLAPVQPRPAPSAQATSSARHRENYGF